MDPFGIAAQEDGGYLWGGNTNRRWRLATPCWAPGGSESGTGVTRSLGGFDLQVVGGNLGARVVRGEAPGMMLCRSRAHGCRDLPWSESCPSYRPFLDDPIELWRGVFVPTIAGRPTGLRRGHRPVRILLMSRLRPIFSESVDPDEGQAIRRTPQTRGQDKGADTRSGYLGARKRKR
jgi:hypothetical protein